MEESLSRLAVNLAGGVNDVGLGGSEVDIAYGMVDGRRQTLGVGDQRLIMSTLYRVRLPRVSEEAEEREEVSRKNDDDVRGYGRWSTMI